MRSWKEVHRLHDELHLSAREIARQLRMSRVTVRRLLSLSEPPRYSRAQGSLLDPYKETIADLLRQQPRMPATKLRERLADLGYPGGLTILKDYLATVRPSFLAAPPYHLAVSPPAPVDDGDMSWASFDLSAPPATHLEPGMNLISANFEIVMVDRTNQRLFRKSITDLLGRKCYREFERRSDVCPHCPAVAALATGRPHGAETIGIRDDGTKYATRIVAYPILGPSGHPLGFIEVESDITDLKRSDQVAGYLQEFETRLAGVHDLIGVVRQILDAAFSLEAVTFGCAYVKDGLSGEYQRVAQRGTPPERGFDLGSDGRLLAGSQTAAVSPPVYQTKATTVLPVMADQVAVAKIALASSTHAEFPWATRVALDAFGTIAARRIEGLMTLRAQRATHAGVRQFLQSLPIPIWCTDDYEMITMWNRAAEDLLGWRASEVIDSSVRTIVLPAQHEPKDRAETIAAADPAEERELRLRAKNGGVVTARATVMGAGAALGLGSERITVLHDVRCRPAEPPFPQGTDDPEIVALLG